MRDQTKKLLSFVAAATMLASTLALSACGDYKLDKPLTAPTGEVASNGGFVVEKGDYVYFINGKEDYTASNKYGDVVKGSLMRITKTALNVGDFSGAEVVVPALVGSQNFNTGIYIYGDYVYYATPTADKNIKGEVESSWIDFKRAKLDGSETMKDYFFRLSSNSTNFRFVEMDGVVYCLYEEDSMLKSYNVETGDTFVLAKGAGTFYFNQKDPTDPTVYYTMNVTYDLDSDKSTATNYNQIYKVSADATATVDSKKASYTVKGGRTYDFNEEYLKEVNETVKETAKKNGTEYKATYDFKDYSTYPYVNLGTLVVDGIGKQCTVTAPYNDITDIANANQGTLSGYKYTISRNENGGVYYTRADSTKLYYYDGAAENTVKANDESEIVALDTKKASSTALMSINEGVHQYIYLDGSNVYRATAAADGTVAEDVKLCSNESSVTLWKTTADGYLYYYASGASSSGNVLTRIKYDGTVEQYDNILNLNESADYRPLTIDYVDFASSWYMPEMVGDVLLYANAKAIGTTSYNYIYATTLGSTAKIEENNEAFEAVTKYMSDELTVDMKNAATYLFRTYNRKAEDKDQNFFIDFKEVQGLYEEANNKKISWVDEFEAEDGVIALFKNKTYIVESDVINMIGEVKETDAESIRDAWKAQLPYPVEEEEEGGLPWWAITLIVVGSALVVAAAVTVPVVIVLKKKKKAAEDEATVNAYKRKKIDTTDDKSIDVYADETPAAPVEEKTEEAVEEAPAEIVEEAPAEEPAAEEATEEEVQPE